MRTQNKPQPMNISDCPAKMSIRERRITFSKELLAEVLATHCRLNKMMISDECELCVHGLQYQDYCGRKTEELTLTIRGD